MSKVTLPVGVRIPDPAVIVAVKTIGSPVKAGVVTVTVVVVFLIVAAAGDVTSARLSKAKAVPTAATRNATDRSNFKFRHLGPPSRSLLITSATVHGHFAYFAGLANRLIRFTFSA